MVLACTDSRVMDLEAVAQAVEEGLDMILVKGEEVHLVDNNSTHISYAMSRRMGCPASVFYSRFVEATRRYLGTTNIIVSGAKGSGKSVLLRDIVFRSESPMIYIDCKVLACREMLFTLPALPLDYTLVVDHTEYMSKELALQLRPYTLILGVVTLSTIPMALARDSEEFAVPAPTTEDRDLILEDLCGESGLGVLTAGRSPLLLHRLVREHGPNLRAVLSQPPTPLNTITWDNVGGYASTVRRLRVILGQWKSCYTSSSPILCSGVLLTGPSGCSKTHMARAMASEQGILFLQVNISDMLSKYYGESEARVRDIFRRARQATTPAIVFIDELDCMARSRQGADTSSSKVQKRVLSTLLNELDGIDSNTGVFFVGATNALEAIDAAMLRPGRIDQIFTLELPDAEDRLGVLRAITSTMRVDPQVDLEAMVGLTEAYTCADLAKVCREAGMNALRRQATSISMQDFLATVKY